MAQYDIHENPNRASRGAFPFVIVLQSDVSIGRHTVVVAPIAPRTRANVDDRAAIPISIDGGSYVVLMQGLAAIPQHKLKPSVGSSSLSERLPGAIDYLFLGL